MQLNSIEIVIAIGKNTIVGISVSLQTIPITPIGTSLVLFCDQMVTHLPCFKINECLNVMICLFIFYRVQWKSLFPLRNFEEKNCKTVGGNLVRQRMQKLLRESQRAYINDLPEVIEHSTCFGYADDYKMIVNNSAELENDLASLFNWCQVNVMNLHESKCKILNFKNNFLCPNES